MRLPVIGSSLVLSSQSAEAGTESEAAVALALELGRPAGVVVLVAVGSDC